MNNIVSLTSTRFRSGSIFTWVVLVFCLVFTLAATTAKKKPEDGEKKKEPIDVTADRMRSENKGDKIIFSGNVVAIWGEMQITCDVMEVYNTPGKEGGKEKSSADQVIAIGNVVMTKGLRKAKGDKAIYYDKTQQVVLTGSPNATAWEADNIITGKEMVFMLEEDRFLVKDKVKMRLYTEKDKPGEDEDDGKSGDKSKKPDGKSSKSADKKDSKSTTSR